MLAVLIPGLHEEFHEEIQGFSQEFLKSSETSRVTIALEINSPFSLKSVSVYLRHLDLFLNSLVATI